MRRARKYLEKDNKDKNKEKEKEKEKENNNIINNEKENEKNEDENKKKDEIKDKYKNGKARNKLGEKNNTNIKEKNSNCFSMQNLFGKKQNNNKTLLDKDYKDNKNKDKAKNINIENKKNENININESVEIKRNQNLDLLKYKKGYKSNKEEEIRKNEEEETKKIKETKDNNNTVEKEKSKKRRKDMIPKKLRNRNLSSKLNEIKSKDILSSPINKEDINTYDESNTKSPIKKQISSSSKNKKKITILEEVQIEEINTTKPVVQINISQIFFQLNNDLNENQKKYKSIYIFGFDKKNNNFIQFDLRKKKFLRIKISDLEDLSDTFEKDYVYQNTILYNTLTGVFILTGKNSDILYYYNPINETIMKICQFKNSHNLGCLLLDEENNRILILGGKNSISCESYNFDINEIQDLPNLNSDRYNASFIISNNKIFGFFGLSFKKGKYLFNIEFINKNILDKWEIIELDF